MRHEPGGTAASGGEGGVPQRQGRPPSPWLAPCRRSSGDSELERTHKNDQYNKQKERERPAAAWRGVGSRETHPARQRDLLLLLGRGHRFGLKERTSTIKIRRRMHERGAGRPKTGRGLASRCRARSSSESAAAPFSAAWNARNASSKRGERAGRAAGGSRGGAGRPPQPIRAAGPPWPRRPWRAPETQ